MKVRTGEWSIRVFENPGIIDWDLGLHFYFSHGDPEFSDLDPYFSSPHVNILSGDEVVKASTRLAVLIRLISGIKILKGKSSIIPGDLYFYENDFYRSESKKENIETFLEELANPFDPKVVQTIAEKQSSFKPNRDKDYAELSIIDPLVRENLLLLALGEEQLLYFLINTYKIIENIKNDLCLRISNGKLYQETANEKIPEYLIESLNDIYRYSQFINSKNASGILSRHGSTNIKAPDEIMTLEDIKQALLLAVNDWLNFKCGVYFKRSYRVS